MLYRKEYSTISRLFSDVEGMTIEQYFILLKIEKVKEWLSYDELSLKEIAWKLGYSSTAHLSAQFKKITSLTASHFSKTGHSGRKSWLFCIDQFLQNMNVMYMRNLP